MSEPFDLMGYIDEETESGGGGGLITEVQIDGVWMVFHKGHRSEETSWAFHSKEDAAEKKLLALEYIDENDVLNSKGKVARPYAGFRITQYADSVLNRDEPLNWTDGQIAKEYVGFSKAYQEILRPSIKEYVGPDNEFSFGERFWAQVSFAPDPENPTYIDSNMEEKPNLVPYIAFAFANRQEALEAAESDDAFAYINIPDNPNYPYDDWGSYARDAVRTFVDDIKTPLETFEVEGAVSLELVEKLRAEAEAILEQDIPF